MRQFAHEVFNCEIAQLNHLNNQLDDSFDQACQLILNTKGKVIIIGIGKSGHIGNKIAATLASTGTPAFFIHPAEAGHGDFGMIDQHDLVIAISNSGATQEVVALLPFIKKKKNPLIAITSRAHSPLADAANVFLNLHLKNEACPYNLAPTSSTTATLVLGDALAIAVMRHRNFTDQDFALSHPAGSLGKRLLFTVNDIMLHDSDLPIVQTHDRIASAISTITQKRLGAAIVIDDQQTICGVFTDGDLRRVLTENTADLNQPIAEKMTPKPVTISPYIRAYDALKIMDQHKIDFLVAVNEAQQPIGVITMKILIHHGIV